LKPVFIIAIVFSIAISLVGVVAMTNTTDTTSAANNTPAANNVGLTANQLANNAAAEKAYNAAIARTEEGSGAASYKADSAPQAPTTNYGSSAYNTPQAPTTNYGSSAYNTPQAPTTNYGSAEPYVPPKLDFKPIQIPEPKYQFKEPDRSVITDHKLDIPNFKPNPIPKSMPIPPSINPAKQFDIPNPGRDIVLSRENPGIPSSAWNP